ncbi:hypothetical protein F511_30771 [Dorcoceras hygrometricum]|uniref:Uncharacterized protein n=1 Tax=Dorcoceras hygrometricum TaxID=472368 RepID=A0A2Z7AFU2_9LAMI|nr:hypothetical protein F511_30771 [Dorcoceras hygrometricum]
MKFIGCLGDYLAGNLCLDPTGFVKKAALHGITDSACKNQLVVVSVRYGPFNPYIPIRSTTIGKSRVAVDPIAMHTSWRSNSDIASVTSIGYPRMSASGESSTTMHRLLHASGSHPIPMPYDPKSTTGDRIPSSACTRRPDEIGMDGFSSSRLAGTNSGEEAAATATYREEMGAAAKELGLGKSHSQNPLRMLNTLSRVSVRESRIQYLCDPQWFRDTASRGPTTIVAPESQSRTCPTDHDSIGYPRMSASGDKLATMHRLLHASGSHPIPTAYDPKTNQYNQDFGLIHSTNGNHLESPNEGSSIDHQVTIYLHAQNITMFPTNETWYFASQILVSSSGGLILIFTAQSTRNMIRIHSDY